MVAIYHLLAVALALGIAKGQSWLPSASSCPSLDNSTAPSNLYINIFHEVTTKHPEILSQLTMAPLVNGMDTNLPAFEFVGMGSGFLMPNFSSAMREASCIHKEVTFSGFVYIRNSESDGPLLEVAYSSGLEAGRPVYIINMDAGANEITVAFRHGGRLYSEIIAIRLISGKWRRYSIVLSGNQLSFYFDCELHFQKIIPLPDYCYDNSPLVVGVLSSVYEGVEYVGHSGLMVYVQNLAIEFGSGGNKRVCLMAKASCPSCGQFLTYLERLTETQEKVQRLTMELANLHEMGVVNRSAVCRVAVNGQEELFSHGNFKRTSLSEICYCDNGTSVCSNFTSLEVPKAPTDSTATTGNMNVNPPTVDSRDICPTLNLREGEFVGMFANGKCEVSICTSGAIGLTPRLIERDCDSTLYGGCPSTLDAMEQEVATCCGICSKCNFVSCGLNEHCAIVRSKATCQCDTGYIRNASNICVDTDECEHVTCMENSECINNQGSYVCECLAGYGRRALADGSVVCEDINECRVNTDNCSVNSKCNNLDGGYSCSCHAGYVPGTFLGECTPTCTPTCMNGGSCIDPNNCSCPPQYQGRICQLDVNECLTPGRCSGGQLCVNTVGGFFCRCSKGYSWDGTACTDINECKLGIDNCKGTSSNCMNTEGGFTCSCSDLGPQEKECTGSCIRKGMRVLDKQFMVDRCKNCTCHAGDFNCVPVACDCANKGSWPQGCCQECNRRDCSLQRDGRTILIRPGSTWVDPSDRCQRFDCSQELEIAHVNVSDNCPDSDCPEKTVPMGRCCPVCLLPRCDSSVNGQTVSVHNGCRIYTCSNSSWVLTTDRTCSTPTRCTPEDIVFFKDGCCPVCRQDILGSSLTKCPS